MKTELLRELRSNYEFMSQIEQKITSVILSDPQKFTQYSLTSLADVAKVSQGSVINFAKKYCGGGFPSLKLAVAACLPYNEEKPFSSVDGTDSLKDVLNKTATDINDALSNTAALNDESDLKRAADMILMAEKVEIYGIFKSAVVANDFYFQLLQTGIHAAFVSDVLTCAVSASMLGKGSLVVAISASGQTQDVIDAVRLAKENGVPVICITAHKNSTLASLSDVVLVASPSGNSLSASANEIRISQLAITDALCSYLRSMTDSDGNKRYYKMNEILKLHNVKD